MISRSFGRVIVGVGGSPGSLHALRHAVELSRALDAPLLTVLAWEPPGGEMQVGVRPEQSLVRIWEGIAERRLQAAIAEGLGAMPADIRAETHVVRGPTARS